MAGRSSVPIPVEHPARPFTSYGISKKAGEQLSRHERPALVSLRLANVSGPRLAIGPIPTFYKRLKAGQGCFCTDAVRDFLDMDDSSRLMDLVHGATTRRPASSTSRPAGPHDQGNLRRRRRPSRASRRPSRCRGRSRAPTTCPPSCSIRANGRSLLGWKRAK